MSTLSRPSILAGRTSEPLDAEDQWLRVVGSTGNGLTRAEECALARRIQEGDTEALDALVNANLRFGVAIAKKYIGRGLPLSDLIQEANTGLVVAARRFSPDAGVKFISYAVWWVKQCILKAISEQSKAVRIPTNRMTEINRIVAAQHRLAQVFERQPTAEEIADEAGLPVDLTRDLHLATIAPLRLDISIFDDRGSSLADTVADPAWRSALDQVETDDHNEFLHKRLRARLKEREYRVVCRYYGLDGEGGATLDEIGQVIGVTRERVRQIKEAALHKLRDDAALARLVSPDGRMSAPSWAQIKAHVR